MKSDSIEQLIDLLKDYQKDRRITNQWNEPFIHIINNEKGDVILSTKKPIAVCKRTGSYIYPTNSENKDYFGYCPELDEDVYEFETIKLD